MNILTEIIEVADNIMTTLEEQHFFEDFVFCDPLDLRREIEIQMQRNWEQTGNMYMSDNQFIELVEKVSKAGIDKTVLDAVEDGWLVMDSIDKNGEILYKLNPDLEIRNFGSIGLN